jgi:hypothetical protein
MRWIVVAMVLVTALIVVLAVMIGSSQHGKKRSPRIRGGAPPALVVPI